MMLTAFKSAFMTRILQILVLYVTKKKSHFTFICKKV